MRSEEYPKKDGTTGTRYYPEDGDVVTAEFDKVSELEYLGVKKATGKPFKGMRYSLGVRGKNGKSVYLVLTGGQKKVLEKAYPLKDKKIHFQTYNHKQYGELLGARVDKE